MSRGRTGTGWGSDQFYFIFEPGEGSRRPLNYLFIKTWQVHNRTKALASLALKILIFEDKAFVFTENTLTTEKLKQFKPWVPLPHTAGVLKALPPRNRSQLLRNSLPAPFRRRGPPPSHGERITSWPGSFEHPRRRRKASALEVDISPPCRQRVAEAKVPPSWMSS
jgi:hypothetical protein